VTSKFKIGDKVTSTINPRFLGHVVAITRQQHGVYYTVAHFDEEDKRISTMYDFEIELAKENGNIGFQN